MRYKGLMSSITGCAVATALY